MDWSRNHYRRVYAPNIARDFPSPVDAPDGRCRYSSLQPRQTRPCGRIPLTQFIRLNQASCQCSGLMAPIVCQILGKMIRKPGSSYRTVCKSKRNADVIPIKISEGQEIKLSSGEHSQLIKNIIEDFGPRYVPGGRLVYVGDTSDKWRFFDQELSATLGVIVDGHGKMPDVVIYCTVRNWLLLIESVTSHGPVDGKRHAELAHLFSKCTAGLVYVSAFPNRRMMYKYLNVISWETEVWVADAPSHMIHFNGSRFLGPY